MEITYKDKKLEKIINDPRKIRKHFNQAADNIVKRIMVLARATNLEKVSEKPPTRLHLLKGDYKGYYAVDVNRELRIVFEINHDPVARRSDNSVDLEKVTKVCIVDILDYH